MVFDNPFTHNRLVKLFLAGVLITYTTMHFAHCYASNQSRIVIEVELYL